MQNKRNPENVNKNGKYRVVILKMKIIHYNK